MILSHAVTGKESWEQQRKEITSAARSNCKADTATPTGMSSAGRALCEPRGSVQASWWVFAVLLQPALEVKSVCCAQREKPASEHL